MVTLVGITSEGLGVYRGLSTDLPLSPAPKNGSRFFAMDNGKTYWYDADNSQWLGYSSGGGGGGGSGLLGYKETITVINNNYTDTNAVRLADLEAQIITALGQLGNDEKAQLKYVNVANAVWMSTQSPATWLDNTVTVLDMRFMIFNVSTANDRADLQSLRIHPNSANTFYNRLRLETTPAITITDYSSGTNNNDMIAYIDVYKEV